MFYEIQIDGAPVRVVEDNLTLARETALELAQGQKAVQILFVSGGIVPVTSQYWDYEISNWVQSDPVYARPKRRDEE